MNLTAGLGSVAGLRSQSVEIETAAIPSLMGVVFRPGGACAFFEAPASDFHNHVVPLDVVWGSKVSQLHYRLREGVTAEEKFQILETALVSIIKTSVGRGHALHPSVRYGLREFRHVPHMRTVIDVAREASLSRRRFSQLFHEQVGMTPKLYCRLIRFRAVMREIAAGSPVDWADVAVAGGYYDQAHLAHEFREFSGMSPTSYLAADRPSVNHVRIA